MAEITITKQNFENEVLNSDKPVTEKVFVIDDETHSTMILANEY